jgi:hypothetical protein
MTGETLMANTIWLELAPTVDAIKPSKIAQAVIAPTAPPKEASNRVSSKTAVIIGTRRNPIARRVAISRARGCDCGVHCVEYPENGTESHDGADRHPHLTQDPKRKQDYPGIGPSLPSPRDLCSVLPSSIVGQTGVEIYVAIGYIEFWLHQF